VQVRWSTWILPRERCTVISVSCPPLPLFKRCCRQRCHVSPTSCSQCFPMSLPALGNADPRLDVIAHSSDLLHACLEPCCLPGSLGIAPRPIAITPSSRMLAGQEKHHLPLTACCPAAFPSYATLTGG